MTILIYTHNNTLSHRVHRLSRDRVAVELPSGLSDLILLRDGTAWILERGSLTPARCAIIRAWSRVADTHMKGARIDMRKDEKPTYKYVVRGDRLYRLTQANYERLMRDFTQAKHDLPQVNLRKYRAMDIGESPPFLDILNREAARLLLETDQDTEQGVPVGSVQPSPEEL